MKRVFPDRRRGLIAVGLLAALALLVALLRGLARELIAVPLAYLLWLARQFFNYVPQLLIWAWLLVMLAVLAFKSLTAGGEASRHDESGPRPVHQERIAFWSFQVGMAMRGSYYRARFSDFFGRLILAVMAYQRHANPAQFERDVRAGLVEIPPVVRPYVILAGRSLLEEPRGWLAGLRARLSGRPPAADGDDRAGELRKAVEFLEEQLENTHEHRDP